MGQGDTPEEHLCSSSAGAFKEPPAPEPHSFCSSRGFLCRGLFTLENATTESSQPVPRARRCIRRGRVPAGPPQQALERINSTRVARERGGWRRRVAHRISERILCGAAPAELPRATEEILCVGQRPEIGAVWGCCALTSWRSDSACALARSERGGNFPPRLGDSLPRRPQPNASELEPAAGCSVKGLPYLDVFFLEQETWGMRKKRDAWMLLPCCCCSATLLHLLSPLS